MNNLLQQIIMIADTNISNMTGGGFLRWCFQPFYVLHDFTVPVIMLLPLLIIGTRIGQYKAVAMMGYLFFVGLVCSALFPPGTSLPLQIISAIILVPFIYFALIKKNEDI